MKDDNEIYHDFCSEFYDPKSWTNFKYQGVEFIRKLEMWAMKWPAVQIVSADDACAAGSCLVLFPVGRNICLVSVPQFGRASELSVFPKELTAALGKIIQHGS